MAWVLFLTESLAWSETRWEASVFLSSLWCLPFHQSGPSSSAPDSLRVLWSISRLTIATISAMATAAVATTLPGCSFTVSLLTWSQTTPYTRWCHCAFCCHRGSSDPWLCHSHHHSCCFLCVTTLVCSAKQGERATKRSLLLGLQLWYRKGSAGELHGQFTEWTVQSPNRDIHTNHSRSFRKWRIVSQQFWCWPLRYSHNSHATKPPGSWRGIILPTAKLTQTSPFKASLATL